MKRTLTVFLLILILINLMACNSPEKSQETDSTEVTTVPGTSESTLLPEPETTLPESGESDFVKDDIPEGLNFNKTINILYWSDVEQPEFYIENQTGDIICDGIFDRNINTEERLGVKLNFIGTPGNFQNQSNFIRQAQNSINAGGEYDIFAGYSMTGATLAVNGFVYNLKEMDYIDFDKPWWPSSLTGQATINNKLYFASGDISTNMLHMMYAVFFNKQLIIDHALEDPYALVDDGKWTYTKLFEMCEGCYNNLNGNDETNNIKGKEDKEDAYGLCTAAIHYDAFFTGAGLNTIEKDASDNLIISPSFNSEKTVKLLEDVCSFMWEGKDGFHGSTGEVFSKGNTVFTLDRSYMSLIRKDDILFEYGIVPVPKYDEAQEQYNTCLGFPYTMYAISFASKQPEAAAATLECLASEGYREVTPMLFEHSMKYKYTHDNDSARMYDIIRQSVSIDIGRIFNIELANLTCRLFRTPCENNTPSHWASAFKSSTKVMERALDKINKSIAKLD